MRKILFIAAITMASPLLLSSSCKNATQCKDVICTMMFASVTTQVQNAQGEQIQLDEVYTVRQANGDKIRLDQQMTQGRYHVLDDSYLKNITNTRETYIFTGIKDGKKIIEEPFVISADCCHVKKESGKELIVVK